jgi:SNF2 family DNA or RNA helicase
VAALAPLLKLDMLQIHARPSSMCVRLRPSQRKGFRWLASLWDLELVGIPADVGLGKTLQARA